MSEQETSKLPDKWIKILTWTGLVMLIVMYGGSLMVNRVKSGELKRLAECQAQMRQDCDPSFVWSMAGYTAPAKTVAQP